MRFLLLFVLFVNSSIIKKIPQNSILLHSPRQRRSTGEDIIDLSSRLISFTDDNPELSEYTASVILEKSLLSPHAIHPSIPLPKIYSGIVRNSNYEPVGSGKFQFQSNDVLTRFTIDDGNELNGRIQAELDPESDDDNDLIIYREKPAAEIYHKGRCSTPLGATPTYIPKDILSDQSDANKKRTKRAPNEQRSKKKQAQEEEEIKQNEKLMSESFPRDCSIKIVADELFFMHVGKNSTEKTIGYMISVIDRANDIFKRTNWLQYRTLYNEDKSVKRNFEATGFGFTIAKIEIWNDTSKPDQYLNRTQILRKSDPEDPSIDAEHPECNQPDSRAICRYLKQFSKTGDHGDVCLAHLFTYYDFDTGILGLAHIGKHEGSSMGICAGGKRDENKAFLNTALTTTLNWKKRILSTEAELVTVHELGHNWGANHDNVDAAHCEPGGAEGNYIMYRNAVSVEHPNNDKFSSCSRDDIIPKLLTCGEAYFRHQSNNTCGNFRVEPTEQCDPGATLYLSKNSTSELCCTDSCTLREGAECDGMNPIEQACCTNCQFSSNEIECRPATQCKEASKCPSDSAICPDQVNKPDGTPCKDSDGRESSCSNGKCQNRCDSLSDLDPIRFNYTNRLAVCLCGVDQEEWMCARCCQSGKNKSTCQPAHIWEEELKGSTEGETWLSVNATCAYGNCELDKKQDKVKCKKRQDVDVMDIVHSVWSYLQPHRFSTFAKNNIVGAVMIFSAIFWIPISILISYIDRKRKQHNEKTRFQWPDYMSSFSQTYPGSSYGPSNTINQDILKQLTLQQQFQQVNGGSYALQVMNQLTHHILQENVKQPSNLQTPKSDDFQPSPDYQNSSNNNNSSEISPNKPSYQTRSHSKVLQKGLDARISWFTSSTRNSIQGGSNGEESVQTTTTLVSKETSL